MGQATELLSAARQHCWQQNAPLGGLARPAGPWAAASYRQHPSGLTKTAKVGRGSACWRSNVSHKQLKCEGAVVPGKGCAGEVRVCELRPPPAVATTTQVAFTLIWTRLPGPDQLGA